MKQTLRLLLCLLLLAGFIPAALAEDVFAVRSASDAASGASSESYIESSLTTDRSYLRVDCYLEEEVPVLLSIANESGLPIYQRDYGLCSGSFRSEDIYLPMDSAPASYEVTLTAGESVYAFPVRRLMPRVTGAQGCAAGYPLSGLSGVNTWQTATLLELASLDGGSLTVPLCAGNAYELGEVTFSVSGGQLTVSAELTPGVDGSIDGGTVYAALTALEASSLGRKSFSGAKARLNSAINLNDASYAAVYVQLTLSYAPTELPAAPDLELSGQDELWQHMQNETVNEAVG